MFTGIIQAIGQIKTKDVHDKGAVFSFASSELDFSNVSIGKAVSLFKHSVHKSRSFCDSLIMAGAYTHITHHTSKYMQPFLFWGGWQLFLFTQTAPRFPLQKKNYTIALTYY